ncbi:MAG: prephenate dehydratase [Chloroflexi bacterium]|nr:prephenate dehydratase [Chloroflexota bacterium]
MDVGRYRREIDALDQQIIKLLNDRARLAQAIGRLKEQGHREAYDPARERQVLEHVAGVGEGPLPPEAIRSIYNEILSACRSLERPLSAAYLGPEATFTHEAAKRHFGSSAILVPAKSIDQVFLLTEKGEVDYGLVPVENSLEGAVSHTLDMFQDSELNICAEVTLNITHALLGRSPLKEIQRVYSHPQAIAQSRSWLSEHLAHAEIVEVASTARGAQLAAEEPGAGAVAPELAAELYGLDVLARNIEDSATNVTRFLIIGKQMSPRSGRDRTALLFAIRDRVGALHDALAIFLRHSINLSMIQSRPSRRRAWDYVFFVDLEGHPEDAPVKAAIDALSHECLFVKVLGAWPRE